MTEAEAQDNIGQLVRLKYRYGHSSGYCMAKLLSVHRQVAEVHPQGHKRSERVTLDRIRPWLKGRQLQRSR